MDDGFSSTTGEFGSMGVVAFIQRALLARVTSSMGANLVSQTLGTEMHILAVSRPVIG